MAEIANLSVSINADTKDLEAGLARAQQHVSGAGSAIQSALGAVAVGAVAGLGAAFVGSVKSAADFEKQMSAISAVSGASAGEMKALTATALQLGKDTSFSAKEAAVGIEELVKAGVSVADVMGGGARAALDLAAAGAISVGDAAEIASNAMNVFGKSGAEMAHVADVIAGAANSSAISVNDYKFSLASAGAVAATIGITFEDLSVAIAAMGNAGIKGSDAGTSLKTMMLNLSPASKSALTELKKLGIVTLDNSAIMEQAAKWNLDLSGSIEDVTQRLFKSVTGWKEGAEVTKAQTKAWADAQKSLGLTSNAFFTAEGNVKSFRDISEILKTSIQGLTREQQINAIKTVFGTDAIRAAAILAQLGAEKYDELAAAINKVSARAVADERLNNLAGSLEKLKGSLETAAIILGGQFTPALKSMADAATEHANTLIDVFEQIPDAIETVKQVLAGEWAPDASIRPFTLAVGEAALALNAQFGPAVETVGTFITGTLVPAFQAIAAPLAAFSAGFLGAVAVAGLVTAAIGAVTVALGFLLSPLGLVALAVGLLAAAWTTNFMGIQEQTAAMWAAVQPVLTELVAWLGEKIPPVLTWISTVGWPALVTAGQAVSEWITGTAIPALTQLVEWLGPKLVAVTTWISGTGWPALVAAGEKVVTIVDTLSAQFAPLLVTLEKFKPVVDPLVASLGKFFDVLAKIMGVGLDRLVTFIGDMATKFAATVSPVDSAVVAVGKFFGVINSGLTALEKFLSLVGQLQNIKMPSLTMPGGMPGGGGGSGAGSPTTLSNTTGANAHVAPHLPLINQIANEMGVPAHRLAALMEVEGSGATAVSPANARGLMQVVPGQGYDLPGEDWRDPATSIRQGARALKDKYNQVGSWDEAGRAYFGYGVDAGGMRTDVYGQRYDAASQRYQQTFTPAPPAAPGRTPGQRLPGDMDKALTGAPGASPAQWPGFMNQVNEQLPSYLTSLDTIQGRGAETFVSVLDAGVAAGGAMVTAATDSFGEVTRIYSDASGVLGATITNAAGVIVNTWSMMGATVVATNVASNAAVVADQVATGTRLISEVTNAAGVTVARYLETSGQIVTIVTAANGQVIADFTRTAAEVQLVADNSRTQLISTVTDAMGQTTEVYREQSGQIVTIVTDMGGKVVQEFNDVATAAKSSASGIDSFKATMASIKPPNLSAVVKEFEKVEKAAKQAWEAGQKIGEGMAGGKKSGSGGDSGLGKRAFGGPVDIGETYLVGERGPELFTPSRSGAIIANRSIGGGGTVVNLTVQGTLVHERELPALIAQSLGQALRDGVPIG